MGDRIFPVVALAALLVLAGCSGADTATTGTPTTEQGETNASVGNVTARAVTAMEAVDRYEAEAAESRTIAGNLLLQVDVEQSVEIDRPDRRLHRAVNQSAEGRTVALDVYVVDGTTYQRSAAFVRQFSTEWIKIEAEGNASRAFRVADPLARQKRVLEAADTRLVGTETVNGTETYRVETTSGPGRLSEVFAELVGGPASSLNGSSASVSGASYTFWLSTETARPVKVAGRINSTASAQGRSVSVTQSFTFRYAYDEPVSVTLPGGADSAVSLSELRNGTAGG